MFVTIIKFPPIKEGKDEQFRRWFEESNREFAKFPGFVRRRLLKPYRGGTYVGLVEHENPESFMGMHNSPRHDGLREMVAPIFDGKPEPAFYQVVIE